MLSFAVRVRSASIKLQGWMNNNPSKVACGCITGAITMYGFNDYNREITHFPEYQQRNPVQTELIAHLHKRASNRTLTFINIVCTREHSEELFYLYKRAINKKTTLPASLEGLCFPLTEHEVEDAVAKSYREFTLRITRRALIRNGCLLKWFKAMVRDEIINVFVAPTLSFIDKCI